MTMKSLFYSREVELWLRDNRSEQAATAYRGDCEHSYYTFIRYNMNDTREAVLRFRTAYEKVVNGKVKRYRESVTSYVNGETPPHYPMPVSRGAVRWQDMDLPALLAFGFENWLHDARPTWGEHATD